MMTRTDITMNNTRVQAFSVLRHLYSIARHLGVMATTLLLFSLSMAFSFSALAATTTTLTTSVTTVVVGTNMTLTASVAGVSPTGNVVFKDGTTIIGTVATTGTTATRTAVLTTNFITVGTHSITAAYAGDANDATSTSTAKAVTATIKATTTTLTTSVTTAAVGANVTLTATTTGYTPTGSVTFKDGTATIGTGILSGTGTTGTATLATTFSTVASHSITVVYAGDANDATSTSAAKAVTVTKATTTTTVTSSLTSAVIGQSVSLTATVAGLTPTGTVTFKDGATTIGTGTLTPTGTGTTATATLTTTFSTAASHSITAVYAGDTDDNTSTSAAKVITVITKAATTTTLTTSLTTATVGQSVTLTATTSGFTPTGTVTFKDGTTTIGTGTLSGTGSTATANLTTSFSTATSHSITAVYAGDSNDATSTSAASIVTVTAITTSTLGMSLGTTAPIGYPIVLIATVTGLTPTGIVTFKDGTTVLGTGTLSGTGASRTATLNTSFSTIGVHNLTAVYAGDADDPSSTSNILSITANLGRPSVAFDVTPKPPVVGDMLSFTVSVSGGFNPTGTLTYTAHGVAFGNNVNLGTSTLVNGSSSFSAIIPKNDTFDFTVEYSGDANNEQVFSAPFRMIVYPALSTSAALSVSPNPASVGQTVTLTAMISGGARPAGGAGNPTGTVTFKDGTTILGTGTITAVVGGGTASFSTSTLSAGSHNLTAVYGGDLGNSNSTSLIVAVTVNAVATTTSLSLNPTTAATGQSVTLTATVAGLTPTGNVTFMDGATTLGTVATTGTGASRTATLITTFSTVGAHSITAGYAGDADDAASTSTATSVTVNAAATTTTLSLNPTSANIGQSVALTATVAGLTPTGTVTFKEGAITLGTGTLTGTGSTASATFTTSFSTTGTHSITAVFAGDADDAASTSSASTITVNAPNVAPTVSITAPANNANFTAPASFSLTANATDSDGTITKVDFYNGATLLASVTSAPYSFNVTGLAVGAHSFTAVATDNSNATTTSATTQVTIVAPNVPPTISITAPANNSSYPIPATVTITANAADSDGTISKVDFYNGATLMSTVTTAPYSVTLAGFTAGSYTFTAVATDNSNAATTSSAVTISVTAANMPPSVSIITPADNSSVILPATVTIAANATDSDGTISKVDFYSNAILMTSVTAAPYSVTLAGFNLGSYTFTAVATDNSGASTTSAPVNISVTSGASQVYYIHTDQLNTPRLITDSNNAKVWEWNNDDPFGNNPPNDDPNATGKHFTFNQRFAGQYADKETGTNYNYFRDYDAETGRYRQSDPIGLEGGLILMRMWGGIR